MPVGLAAQQFIIHANGDSIKGDIEGDQFDSKPPEGADENDLGATLALGWSL
jgi:hypothetical protein